MIYILGISEDTKNHFSQIYDIECRQVVLEESETDAVVPFPDVGEMTEEIWERFVKEAQVALKNPIDLAGLSGYNTSEVIYLLKIILM